MNKQVYDTVKLLQNLPGCFPIVKLTLSTQQALVRTPASLYHHLDPVERSPRICFKSYAFLAGTLFTCRQLNRLVVFEQRGVASCLFVCLNMYTPSPATQRHCMLQPQGDRLVCQVFPFSKEEPEIIALQRFRNAWVAFLECSSIFFLSARLGKFNKKRASWQETRVTATSAPTALADLPRRPSDNEKASNLHEAFGASNPTLPSVEGKHEQDGGQKGKTRMTQHLESFKLIAFRIAFNGH